MIWEENLGVFSSMKIKQIDFLAIWQKQLRFFVWDFDFCGHIDLLMLDKNKIYDYLILFILCKYFNFY